MMHMEKGSIAHFETDKDARDAGYELQLSKDMADTLRQLKRTERLAILAAPHRLAKLPGMTDDDVRRLRNAAKRARRAKR